MDQQATELVAGRWFKTLEGATKVLVVHDLNRIGPVTTWFYTPYGMTTDNVGLQNACAGLLHDLSDSQSRLHHGDPTYHAHIEFADRAISLSEYLKGALALITEDKYAPAFAVLRAAMEHHLLDLLLFRGHVYTVIAADVSEETLAEWKASLAAGELAPDIRDFRRRGSRDVEVVRSGIHFTGEGKGPNEPSLSIYYGIIDRYDPFTGGKKAQRFIGHWRFQEEVKRDQAAKQAEVWHQSLTWEALIRSVALNDFYSEAEIARWGVHYSFLSAFSHPVSKRAVASTYGRNMPIAIRSDHYAAELALLYIGTIASLELEAFDQMSKRAPTVELHEADRVLFGAEQFRRMTSYFWFPSGPPDIFDRVQEANQRAMLSDRTRVPLEDRLPNELTEGEVKYYQNPLRRLIEMHVGINEITGFAWASPWILQDAQQRLLDC